MILGMQSIKGKKQDFLKLSATSFLLLQLWQLEFVHTVPFIVACYHLKLGSGVLNCIPISFHYLTHQSRAVKHKAGGEGGGIKRLKVQMVLKAQGFHEVTQGQHIDGK